MTNAENQARSKATLWTREKIAQLIQLYRANECLWNHYTEQYKSKNVRTMAVASICDALNVSKAEYGKKIHNLRNQFNSEMKKLERRIESSGGKVEDITSHSQKCRWEHFESLMFLRTVIEPRPGGYQLNASMPTKKIRFKYDYNSEEETSEQLTNQGGATAALTSLPVEIENADYVYEDGGDDHVNYEETVATEDTSMEERPPTKEVDAQTSQLANERLPITTTSTLTTSGNCLYVDGALLKGKVEEVLQSNGSNEPNNQLSCQPTPATLITPSIPSAGNELLSPSKELSPQKAGGRDQWDIFGEMVATEFRNFNSDVSRKKLKRKIMQAMLEVGEEDDNLKA